MLLAHSTTPFAAAAMAVTLLPNKYDLLMAACLIAIQCLFHNSVLSMIVESAAILVMPSQNQLLPYNYHVFYGTVLGLCATKDVEFQMLLLFSYCLVSIPHVYNNYFMRNQNHVNDQVHGENSAAAATTTTAKTTAAKESHRGPKCAKDNDDRHCPAIWTAKTPQKRLEFGFITHP
jgi:hypothetical protein